MNNERKNHRLPSAPTFHTLEQLENSIDSLGAYDPHRSKRYRAMKTEAISREITHLEGEERRGVITQRGRKTLNRLNELKEEQV